MEHEYEEFLTPEEIREMYGLEEDEDLVEFIKEANRGHKSKIIIITQPGEGDYCNTIKEIEEKLKEYNKKNNTEYILEIEYVLYTTKNCGICNMVKHLINSKNLKISIKESDENDIQYLIKNKISNFPVLQIKAGEKVEFIFGKDAGEYIASNLQKFK